MKKLLLLIMVILLMAVSVTANTVTRSAPSTVTPGEQFTVTYTATGNGELAAVVEDVISGGCTPGSKDLFMVGSSPQTQTLTYTAPQSGTCTFSGTYQFADQAQKQLGSTTISVSGTATACTNGQEQSQSCSMTNGCQGTQSRQCEGGSWSAYSSCQQTDSTCGTGNNDDSSSNNNPPSLSFDKCLVDLSGTCITLMHVLLIVVGLVIFSFLK